MKRSRRSILGGIAVCGGLAGCTGLVEDSDDESGEESDNQSGDTPAGTNGTPDGGNQTDGADGSTEPAETISVEREPGGGESPKDGLSLEERDDGTELVVDAQISIPTPCHEIESWDWSFTESNGRLTIDLTFVDTSGPNQACTTVVVGSQQQFRISDPEQHVTEVHIAGIDEMTIERSEADSS